MHSERLDLSHNMLFSDAVYRLAVRYTFICRFSLDLKPQLHEAPTWQLPIASKYQLTKLITLERECQNVGRVFARSSLTPVARPLGPTTQPCHRC